MKSEVDISQHQVCNIFQSENHYYVILEPDFPFIPIQSPKAICVDDINVYIDCGMAFVLRKPIVNDSKGTNKVLILLDDGRYMACRVEEIVIKLRHQIQ